MTEAAPEFPAEVWKTMKASMGVLCILLMFSLCGCDQPDKSPPATARQVTVAQLMSTPSFVGQRVTLTGTVTEDFAIADAGMFRLTDATGSIAVINTQASPNDHQRIEVEGVVHQALVAGSKREYLIVATRWTAKPLHSTR